MDNCKNCTGKNAKEIVEEFYKFLLQTGYCSIQEFEYPDSLDNRAAIPEMFTARLQTNTAKTNESLIICGNTAVVEGSQPTLCLEKDTTAVDFDRIFVFKGTEVEELKKCLLVLVTHWIDTALTDGGYANEGQSKGEEIALICSQMLLWDDTQKWFGYYGKPENATARYEKEWFSCREGFSANTPKGSL